MSKQARPHAWLVLAEGETVRRIGQANLLRNGEGVGGWLALTDRRLVFHSHRFNLTRPEIDRPAADVAACEGFGMLPNGLTVRFHDGGTEQFRVWGRTRWRKLLMAPTDG